MPHLRRQLDQAVRDALAAAGRPVSDRTIQLVVDAAAKVAGTMLGRLRADRDQQRAEADRLARRLIDADTELTEAVDTGRWLLAESREMLRGLARRSAAFRALYFAETRDHKATADMRDGWAVFGIGEADKYAQQVAALRARLARSVELPEDARQRIHDVLTEGETIISCTATGLQVEMDGPVAAVWDLVESWRGVATQPAQPAR